MKLHSILLFGRCSWASKLLYVEKWISDIIPQTSHRPSAGFRNLTYSVCRNTDFNHVNTFKQDSGTSPDSTLANMDGRLATVWTSLTQSWKNPVFGTMWLQHPQINQHQRCCQVIDLIRQCLGWSISQNCNLPFLYASFPLSILMAQPAEFQHAVRRIRQVFAQLFFHLLRNQKPSGIEMWRTSGTEAAMTR